MDKQDILNKLAGAFGPKGGNEQEMPADTCPHCGKPTNKVSQTDDGQSGADKFVHGFKKSLGDRD